MRRLINIFLIALITVFSVSTLSGCKKTAKTAEVLLKEEIEGLKLSPRLQKVFSVFPEDIQKIWIKEFKSNPELMKFLEDNPSTFANVNYLRKCVPDSKLWKDPMFLKDLRNIDKYSKYSGNKFQNYLYKVDKDGNLEVYNQLKGKCFGKINVEGRTVEVSIEQMNNPFLMLKPLPDYLYKVGPVICRTDEAGRVIQTTFHIGKGALKAESHRYGKFIREICQDKEALEGDHGGHLMADQFGGSSNVLNIVPMSAKVNLSDFKKIEDQIRSSLENGIESDMNIELKYAAGSERPSWIIVKVKQNGKEVERVIENK